jgi:predicted HicB family RNase H-like nuclease
MTEEPKKRRREQTMIRLLPKVKEAAVRAAANEDRSLSGFIEEVLAERLKKTGHLK